MRKFFFSFPALIFFILLSDISYSQSTTIGAISFTKMSSFRNYYDLQSNGTPQLIWQDPNNPDFIHAVYTKADEPLGTLFPNRFVYYFFSSDRGFSWTNLGPIDAERTGFGAISGLSNGNIIIAANAGNPSPAIGYTKIFVGNTIGTLSFTKLEPGGAKQFFPKIIATSNVNNTNKFIFMNTTEAPDSAWLNVGTSLTQSNFLGYKQIQCGEPEQLVFARGDDGRIGIAYTNGSLNRHNPRGDVFFMESTDNGLSFSSPLKIFKFNSENDSAGGFKGISIVYQGNIPKVVFESVVQQNSLIFNQYIPPKIKFWSPVLPGTDSTRSITIADSSNTFTGQIIYGAGGNLARITRPSLGTSKDGKILFCSYMAADSANLEGYNYFNIYLTVSTNYGISWSAPKMITPKIPRNDWQYVSVSSVNDYDESNYYVNMLVQRDTMPGLTVSFGTPNVFGTDASPYFVRIGFTRLTGAPQSPVLLLPENNSTSVSVTPVFKWSTTGLLHKIQISTNSGFTNIIYQKDSIPFDKFQMPVGVLQNNTNYFWRVSAANNFGSSSFSLPFSFTTVNSNVPVAPILLSPANGSASVMQPVNLDWNDVPQAVSYRVQVSSFSDFHSEVYFDSSNITISQVTVNPLLPFGKSLYWRVNAKNSFGTSPYSSTNLFSTAALSAPVLISPSDSEIVISNPVIKWQKLQGAQYYNYQVSSTPDFGSFIYNLNTTDSLISLSSFALHERFYWRVRGNNFDNFGPFSNTRSFVTAISPPVLISPYNYQTVNMRDPTLKWNVVPGRTLYNLMLSEFPDFSNPLYNVNLDTTFFYIPAAILQLNKYYYWRVRSKDNIGFGIFSNTWSFKITLVGVHTISEIIPAEFKLFNNYPNPFNPTTKIKFDLPKNSLVKINIFDITGRMINEIVNTNLNAGSYETEFNGDNLSSGIYYYRIEAGNFVETKKMILIK